MLKIYNAPSRVVLVKVYAAFCFYPLAVYAGRESYRGVTYGAPPTQNPADRFGNRPTFHQNVNGSVDYPPSKLEVHYETNFGHKATYHRVWYGDRKITTSLCSAAGQGSVSYSPSGDDHTIIHGQYSVSIRGCEAGRVTVSVTAPGFSWHWSGWEDWNASGFSATLDFPTDGTTYSKTIEYPVRNPNGGGAGPSGNITVQCTAYDTSHIDEQLAGDRWGMYTKTIPQAVLVSQFLLTEHAKALIYSKLIGDVLSKMKLVNINSLAYLGDVAGLVNQFRHAKKGLKRFLRQPTKKKFSNLWLNARYGLPLFVQDSSAIISALRKRRSDSPVQKYSASYKTDLMTEPYKVTCELHMTMYVQSMTREELSFTQSLLALDLYPTATNLWDLVPYSFVADWIINVGEHLEQLDNRFMVAKFPILGAVASVKLITPLSSSDPFHSEGDITTYDRFCLSSSDLTRLPSSIDASVGDGLSLKHGVDALALVVQRK